MNRGGGKGILGDGRACAQERRPEGPGMKMDRRKNRIQNTRGEGHTGWGEVASSRSGEASRRS